MSKSRIKFQEITDWRFDHFPHGGGGIIVSQNKVKGIENLKRDINPQKRGGGLRYVEACLKI